MDTHAPVRFSVILIFALPALPAQFVHRIDPNAATPPVSFPTRVSLVSEPFTGGVLAIDFSGSTFTWDYGSAANSFTQVNPPNALVGGTHDVQFCLRGTGASERAFAWDGPLQQAFEHSDSGWLARTTINPPSPRKDVALIGLPNGDVLLFGGEDPAGAPLGDTFLLGGNTWQQLAPANSPGPRSGMGATFDGVGMTIFGGRAGGPAVADTWQFDGTNWTNLGLSGPPARAFPGMAFRQRDNEIVMVGGVDNGPVADAWVLRGGAWSLIVNGTFNPTSGEMRAVYDKRRDEVVVVDSAAFPPQTFTNSVSGGIHVSTGCPCAAGMQAMGLVFGGSARIGGTINISFANTLSSFVFLAYGTDVLAPPTQVPGFPVGCNAIVDNVQDLVGSSSNGTVNVPIPNSLGLLGLRVVYQATASNDASSCVSDAVDVRIGR